MVAKMLPAGRDVELLNVIQQSVLRRRNSSGMMSDSSSRSSSAMMSLAPPHPSLGLSGVSPERSHNELLSAILLQQRQKLLHIDPLKASRPTCGNVLSTLTPGLFNIGGINQGCNLLTQQQRTKKISRKRSSASSSTTTHLPTSEIPVSYSMKNEPVYLETPPAHARIKGKLYLVRGIVKRWDGKRFARCCEESRCSRLSQGPTSYCKAHGGGTRCKAPDCSRAARGGVSLCGLHGGSSVKRSRGSDSESDCEPVADRMQFNPPSRKLSKTMTDDGEPSISPANSASTGKAWASLIKREPGKSM